MGLAADTWHIQESDPEIVDDDLDVIELHLRDTDSTPPGQGTINFKKIIRALSPQMLCFEFHAATNLDLIAAHEYIKSLIST